MSSRVLSNLFFLKNFLYGSVFTSLTGGLWQFEGQKDQCLEIERVYKDFKDYAEQGTFIPPIFPSKDIHVEDAKDLTYLIPAEDRSGSPVRSFIDAKAEGKSHTTDANSGFLDQVIALPQDDDHSVTPLGISSKAVYNTLKEMEKNRVPMISLDEKDYQEIGSGCSGTVYRTSINGRLAVFKLLKAYAKTNPESRYLESFRRAIEDTQEMRELSQSEFYPSNLGLVYLKQQNLWASAFEFVEGSHGSKSDFANPIRIVRIMKNLAIALQDLDRQGRPYTDIDPRNFILREKSKIVLLDDWHKKSNHEDPRILSRKCFGNFLFGIFHPEEVANIFHGEVVTLLERCQLDELSMRDLSWDMIIQTLEKYENKIV